MEVLLFTNGSIYYLRNFYFLLLEVFIIYLWNFLFFTYGSIYYLLMELFIFF